MQIKFLKNSQFKTNSKKAGKSYKESKNEEINFTKREN